MPFIEIATFFLCTTHLIAAEVISFDRVGRALVRPSESTTYTVPTYWGYREFLRVRHTAGEDVKVSLRIDNTSIDHKKSPSYWQITLAPNRLPVPCPNSYCAMTVALVVQMTEIQTVHIEILRGLMLQPNILWKDRLQIREKKVYGYQMSESASPARIHVAPGDKNSNMDLDLFGYQEASAVYFFPNVHEQNHLGGYPESILLSPDKSYYVADGLFFFEVYASPDSSFQFNDFSIGVEENYVARFDWFEYYVFGFIIVVGSAFFVSLILSIACGYLHVVPGLRSRIFYWLRLRDNPYPNGASKAELKKIDVVSLDDLNIDVEEDICSICLDEFSHETPISQLPCSHVFHKECCETWLRRNKTCPLCKHDISRPINEVAVDEEGDGGNSEATPFQRIAQILRESRLSRVLTR